MGINFPNSPLVGDLWPNPAVAGQGQYTWDGEKWSSGSVPASRASIYAAPFDAMAYNGMQINGSMEVSQELGTTGTPTHNTYALDGWALSKVSTAVVSAFQSGVSTLFPGFQNYAGITVSTAGPASPAATDVVQLLHRIEAYRIVRLAWGTVSAQPITIGFWTRHIRTGTYSVNIRNSDSSRAYVTTYTQNVSNTSEYKTITVPGCTDGTWLTTNGVGITIGFVLAAGTTGTAPAANVWNNSIFYAAPGQVNGVAAISDIFRITGVVVLPGIEAPSAARSPLIMRPYDQELLTCKRYWQNIPLHSVRGHVASAGNIFATVAYPVEARAGSAVTLVKTSLSAAGFDMIAAGTWLDAATLSASGTTLGNRGFSTNLSGITTAMTIGHGAAGALNTTAFTVDARL